MDDVDARPAAPLPMPSPSPWRPVAEQAGEWLGVCVRRTRAESRRLTELLRAARTAEGRRRNLAPLAVLAASVALVVGAAWGMWRGRHGRTR